MANCTQCGAELKNGSRFCTECGAAAPAQEAPATPAAAPENPYIPPQPVYQAAPVYTAPASDVPPAGSKYELISTGGFIGIMLLMCIPVIGMILTIVWACGGCRKYQKRNLARATLIISAIGLVLSLALGFAVKGIIDRAIEETGITQSEQSGELLDSLLSGGELQGLLDQLEGLSGG